MAPRPALRDVDLFRDLADAHLERLAATARESTVRRGETVYRDGDDRLYAVLSGVVDVGRTGRDGRFTRLVRLERGEVFGALVGGAGARPGAAVAAIVPESHLMSWASADLQALMTEDPSFAVAFLRALVARLSGRLQSASDAVYTLLQAMPR